ncbi:MAG: hypothetical protein KTV77_04725 [Wolbachia endosymbiont of Fragariocoptes setiger]|nr:hypothetical protein [Wolbachia endosymbiont of Fragariocoptes setiger]
MTEKSLRHYILEYCSLIINHKTSLDSIPDEKSVKPCLMKGFSFKFKKVESTMENFLNLLNLGKDEPII